jgi:hypothetical protein
VNRRWHLYQQMAGVSFDPLPGMERTDKKSGEPETADAASGD